MEHVLGFDRRGLLTSRTRGTQRMCWDYDGDGNRTRFTDAHGNTTTYACDAAGQVTAINNSSLGEATFTHDASGRIVGATAGDLVQAWAYRNGALSEHTRTNTSNPGGVAGVSADVTMIGRDHDGRITALTSGGVVTRYGYDGAGQLTTATTNLAEPKSPTTSMAWTYDAGGRLVAETLPDGARVYAYDTAGQLVSVTEPDGSGTEYVHDGLGRRTRLIGPDGSWSEYAWGPTGHLNGTTNHTPDGTEIARHELWVDALGELASVDGAELWWDTTNLAPTLTSIGGGQVLSLPGGLTGAGEAWITPGWRAARPTEQTDPWAVLGTANALPVGVNLTGNGGVDVAGLEWLGARAYDPATKAFLSTDPLAPVLGAGWDGNPYAYAGNNPLNTTDPTGLQPLTDAELKSYDKSAGSHWEYFAAGTAVAVGVALMFTGVGGPVGLVLIGAATGALTSGGASVIAQKPTNGSVNMDQVWKDTAVGAVGGVFAGGAGGLLKQGLVSARAANAVSATGAKGAVVSVSKKVLSSSVTRASLANGTGASSSNVMSYAMDKDQDHTAAGYLSTAGTGFLVGAGGSSEFGKMGKVSSEFVGNKLPGLSGVASNAQHSAGPVHWGSIATQGLTNHVGGAVAGYVNTELQPGEAKRDAQLNGALQGLFRGANGPVSGVHASGW